MKKTNKKITFTDIEDKFDTCSAHECTGLITVPPQTEDELENYMDIYDFGPPICKKENK